MEGLFKEKRAAGEDYEKLIAWVRNQGAIEHTKDEVEKYSKKAIAFLDPFPPSAAKEELIKLCTYLSEREF